MVNVHDLRKVCKQNSNGDFKEEKFSRIRFGEEEIVSMLDFKAQTVSNDRYWG